MNALFTINPYLHNGMYVFDDKERGLTKEPFVCGIPQIIQQLTNKTKFTVIFSANKFPSAIACLIRTREECGGNWYTLEGTCMEGWLCPALFKYFDKAPDKIYLEMK
jgi:hypothetical protein